MARVVCALFAFIISVIHRLVRVNRQHGNARQKNCQQEQGRYVSTLFHLRGKYMAIFKFSHP